jgi:glutamyl-Q tRNA(Asp) synthetase
MSQDEEDGRVAAGEAYAWRLSIDRARALLGGRGDDLWFVDETTGSACQERVDVSRLGDVVLARKDTPVSYHLCVVHDDGLQGITHVIRGEDLKEATHLHRLLQALFGLASPVYRFHRLMMGRDGKRLAKRDRSETLAQLRQRGATAQDVRAMTGCA